MALQLREESPKWLAIMQFLHDNGASKGAGCRVRQDDLAAVVGLNPKNVGKYITAMEQHSVVTVRRTTVDGSFHTPRGFNIYTLHCTPEHWRDKLGPAIAAERRAKVSARRAVINRNNARERKRKRLQVKLEELGPDPNAPAPKPARAARSTSPARVPAAPPPGPEPTFAPEELSEIVRQFDEPGVDLTGW